MVVQEKSRKSREVVGLISWANNAAKVCFPEFTSDLLTRPFIDVTFVTEVTLVLGGPPNEIFVC